METFFYPSFFIDLFLPINNQQICFSFWDVQKKKFALKFLIKCCSGDKVEK